MAFCVLCYAGMVACECDNETFRGFMCPVASMSTLENIMTEKQKRVILATVTVILLVVLLSIVLWFELFRVPSMPEGQAEIAASKLMIRLKAVDIFSDLIKLFLGWSIGLLGLLIYVVKSVFEKGLKLKTSAFVLLAMTTSTLMLAIFFGHLALNRIAEMLLAGLVLPVDHELELLIRAQYGLVLLSTLLLLGLTFELFIYPSAAIAARFALRKQNKEK